MRYNSHMCVDCTFRSATAPFTQCLIVMVHDAGTEIFVPCVYSLITSKSESIYLNVLHELIVLTKSNWMPQIITCDFELSHISAIKHEFPSSLSDHNCRIILSNIELLTVVLIEEITTVLRYIGTLTLLRLNMEEKVRTTVVEHFKYKR
ncbi:hypothetical protein HZS_7112 [Henneguya salminicola]|nr:hypothetical protein HZS_7112 [Henneguya salminicola]